MTSINTTWTKLRAFYEARHEPESMRPLAEWYWRGLLSFSLFAIALILMYGIWEFVAVIRNLGAGDSLTRSAPAEILNRKDLDEALGAFQTRRSEYESAKSSPISAPDPSK